MHTNTNTFEASGKQNQQMRRCEIENHKLSRMRSNQGGKKRKKTLAYGGTSRRIYHWLNWMSRDWKENTGRLTSSFNRIITVSSIVLHSLQFSFSFFSGSSFFIYLIHKASVCDTALWLILSQICGSNSTKCNVYWGGICFCMYV